MTTTTPKSLLIPSIHSLKDASTAEALLHLLSNQGVRVAIDCVNWPELFPSAPKSDARMGHDDKALYVLFSIKSSEIRATITHDLGPVASDTCFEIFLKPSGSPLYCNFEFNTLGYANVSRRPGRQGATKFNETELAEISRFPLDSGQLIVQIPLKLIGIETPVSFPTSLEGNLYSCCDGLTRPYFLSWAPIMTETPDFHRPEFFKIITLL